MTIIIDSTTYRSPNYDARPTGMAVQAIVMHTTEGHMPSTALLTGVTLGRLILVAATAFATAVGMTATHKSAVLRRARAKIEAPQ